jgi:hypothetical protein
VIGDDAMSAAIAEASGGKRAYDCAPVVHSAPAPSAVPILSPRSFAARPEILGQVQALASLTSARGGSAKGGIMAPTLDQAWQFRSFAAAQRRPAISENPEVGPGRGRCPAGGETMIPSATDRAAS